MLLAPFAGLVTTGQKVGIMRNAAFLKGALPSTRAPKDNSPERVAFQRRDC